MNDEVTEEMIRAKFEPYGKLDSFIYKTQKELRNPRGGRVLFDVGTEWMGEKLMKDIGQECDIDGHEVKLFWKKNIDFPRRRRSIYVTNLDFKVNEEMLNLFFEICGEITETLIIRDEKNKSTGNAIIEFLERDAAIRSMSLHG